MGLILQTFSKYSTCNGDVNFLQDICKFPLLSKMYSKLLGCEEINPVPKLRIVLSTAELDQEKIEQCDDAQIFKNYTHILVY